MEKTKNYSLISFISIAIFSLTFVLTYKNFRLEEIYQNKIVDSEFDEYENEKVENPKERYEQEFMRLRDPLTNKLPDDIYNREREFILSRFGKKNLLKTAGSEFNWECRGPVNVGGRTRALAFDIDNDSIVLTGSVTGDLWRSTDQGNSWDRTNTPPMLPSVSCITQDTREGKHNIWYYGTGETPLYSLLKSDNSARRSYPSDGIYKSIDGGITWFPLTSTLSKTPQKVDPFDFINKIFVDKNFTDKDVLLISTIGGIMRSSDGGSSWKIVLGDSLTNTEYTDLAQSSNGVFYASLSKGNKKGLYTSKDGIEWTDISDDVLPDVTNRVVLATANSNPRLLYVLISTVSGNSESFKFMKYTVATDSLGNMVFGNGEWKDISACIPKRNNRPVLASQNGYNLVLAVKPNNEQEIFFAGTNLYLNSDGGNTAEATKWLGGYNPQNNSYSLDDPTKLHPDIHGVVFFPNNPNAMFVLCDGGIRFTMDNTQATTDWGARNNGYITGQFYSVGVDHETYGSKVLVGALQDNGCWAVLEANPGASWAIMNSADGMHAQVIDSGRQFLVASQGGRVSRANATKAPSDKNHRVYPDSANGLFINPFATDPSDRRIIYLPMNNSLYRKLNVLQNDSNKNWKRIWWGADYISGIGVSHNNPNNRVYFGTTNGKLFRIDNANDTTTDDLLDVAQLRSTLFPVGGWVNNVAVHPNDGNKAIVVFSNYNANSLFYTTDAGKTWVSIGGNLEEKPDGSGAGPSCRGAAFVSRPDGDIVLVATSAGLFSTKILDGANTIWDMEGAETPLAYAVCEAIDVRQSDGFVGIATHGKGIFSGTLKIKSVQEYANESKNIKLNISPNPISAKSVITLEVSKNLASQVLIYDIKGVLYKQLFNGILQTGKHDFPLAENMPSGVYHVIVKNKDETVSKKIVVQK